DCCCSCSLVVAVLKGTVGMLSYLSVPGASRTAGAKLLRITVITGLWLTAQQAWGADVMAPAAYTPSTAGLVSHADLNESGKLTTGMTLFGSESAMSEADVTRSQGDQEILRDAHRGSAFLGLAFTKRMEFVLGLPGSYEPA